MSSSLSSSDVAVSVRGLSKSYTIAHNAENHSTAAEALMHRLKNPLAKPETETFWALKDVEFDIQKGDVVGIIGRNGAGKSTLLKILSRITEPTTGQIDLYGRVGSLLEVGTGFHPELTGRENVYLNGAILGMKKSEIARQFDAIVDFSGTEQFLDTPVKRYSSGMYVRLAFAVAAHLEPEILIVDEVLAVGDAAFQKKCLGKMEEVSREQGRTVLFVSHNMGVVSQLCTTALLMEDGVVAMTGTPADVIANYLSVSETEGLSVRFECPAPSTKLVTFSRCWVETESGAPALDVAVTKSFRVCIEVIAERRVADVEVSVRFTNALGHMVFTSNYADAIGMEPVLHVGQNRFYIAIPAEFLAAGNYILTLALHRPNVEILEMRENVLVIPIQETGSHMARYGDNHFGSILVKFPWIHVPPDSNEYVCLQEQYSVDSKNS